MSDILAKLNDKQKEAVKHDKGPLLVIAGAGSGKTRALTHKIAYLIQEKNISPWNILAVTFTNKAANEMKARIVKLLANNDELMFMETFGDLYEAGELEKISSNSIPTIGTFHSICVRILRRNIHFLDFENSFAIYDTADQQILMKRIMKSMNIDPKKLNPRAVLSHISNAKNQLISSKDFENYASDRFSSKVAEIYPIYQRELKIANALDFDDIIMKTVELFKKNPEVLDAYQEKFKYISVDEYQDTNKAQFELINLLAEKYRNLTVIGDSDQSIYGFRGASVQNILDFEKHYPDAKVIMLEQNYRSTQIILDASNAIIKRNTQRQEKKLWTDKEGGELLKHFEAHNERHEAEIVANEILNLNRDSEYKNYNNTVVLYRTNAQSRVVEEVFLRYGLPYKIVGGIKFYERKEIKDIIAYLRILQNPSDTVSLLRIINTPARKLGAKTLQVVQDFAQRHSLTFYKALLLANEIDGLPKSKIEVLENFTKLISSLQNLNQENSASAMIKHVLEKTKYKKMLDDGSIEGEARLENIRELISVAKKYDQLEPGMSLSIFLEEISLIADIDQVDTQDNAVTLMTVHSAKGLEFQNVFIIGIEEGIFPHVRSLMDPIELEEERRLMYVAITRAMDNLYLLNAKQRMLYGEARSNPISQFFDDINPDLLDSNIGFSQQGHSSTRTHITIDTIKDAPIPVEADQGMELQLASGDRVSHASFGEGVVVDVKGGVVTVAFEDYKVGIKKLALSIAPLKLIN